MNTRTLCKFLWGHADAIRTVASSRSAIWTGVALVLLTAFARNYDQTFILEKPFLWFFGPLLFSLVSGTWIFLICYGLCARRLMVDSDGHKPPLWSAWPSFMGLFWMTAPIAWLYALPVERFFDSLTAAKANLWLLAVVSLWRVLLMARVFQVICCVPYARTILWVIVAAGIEVLVITVFGGELLAKRIMAGMGGMRNSPEEEILLQAMGNALGGALLAVPVAITILGVWRWHGSARLFPERSPAKIPVVLLIMVGMGFVVMSIPAQSKLHRNYQLEQLIAREEMRAAIEYMNRHLPADFAPARPLPPKLFEQTIFIEALRLGGALNDNDARWVRKHVRHALDVMATHLPAWSVRERIEDQDAQELANGIGRHAETALPWLEMTEARERSADVREWLNSHTNILPALAILSNQTPVNHWQTKRSEIEQKSDWLRLGMALHRLGYTDAITNLSDTLVP